LVGNGGGGRETKKIQSEKLSKVGTESEKTDLPVKRDNVPILSGEGNVLQKERKKGLQGKNGVAPNAQLSRPLRGKGRRQVEQKV